MRKEVDEHSGPMVKRGDLGRDQLGTNQSGMRARNERLVLTLVRRHGALAKSELARMTGLSAQTISVIMRGLEEDGLLLRGDPVRGKVGQPSVPMRLNPHGAYFMGLKIGRRSSEVIVTDFLGQKLDGKRTTYPYPTPEESLAFAEAGIHELMEKMQRVDRRRIAGLGIAMPFFLWDWAPTLQVPPSRMEGWRTFDMRQELASRFEMPVFLQNDATAACGAELVFGPQDGPQGFLYFYVGFFIGGGIVMNGSIFSGHGNSGALGPILVPSAQGGVAPLLDVASLYILQRRLEQHGCNPDALWGSAEAWDIPEEVLGAWLKETADGLAYAIISSCAVIDFECVKIDGWMPAEIRDRLVKRVGACIDRQPMTGLERPEIRSGTIGPDARSRGAASLPLSQRFLLGAGG